LKTRNNKKYSELRKSLYYYQARKCFHCRRPTSFDEWHLHHIKSIGSGGPVYDKKNVAGLCWQCHRKIHDGNIRLAVK